MNVSQSAAIHVTHPTSFMSSGFSMRSVAFAAGTMAETMKMQQSTSRAQPAKNQRFFPKTMLTQAYEVPAFDEIRLRFMNAYVMPNMMIPHTRTFAGASIPTVAMSVEVVISMLYAGAVPAIPIIVDSPMVRESFANFLQPFSIFERGGGRGFLGISS